MPTSPSTRLGLIAPADVGDAIKTFPDVLQALIATLDPKAVVFDAGARASRPTSTPGSPGVPGRVWRSSDDGGIDWDHGTGWVTVRPGLFAALPSAQLEDGRTILFQTAAMSSASQGPWELRYDSTLSGSKWRAMSASPWIDVVTTNETGTTLALADLATVGPSIAVPVAGEYGYEVTSRASATPASLTAATIALVPLAVSASHSFDAGATRAATVAFSGSGVFAAGTAKLQYSTTASQAVVFGQRVLRLTPLRVG